MNDTSGSRVFDNGVGTQMITAPVPRPGQPFSAATHLDLDGNTRSVELTPLQAQPWH